MKIIFKTLYFPDTHFWYIHFFTSKNIKDGIVTNYAMSHTIKPEVFEKIIRSHMENDLDISCNIPPEEVEIWMNYEKNPYGHTTNNDDNRPQPLWKVAGYIPDDIWKYLESIAHKENITPSIVFYEICRKSLEDNKDMHWIKEERKNEFKI